MLKKSEEAKKKAYYARNKKLSVWMPESLYDWFIEYLEKYSYGRSKS